MFSRFFVFFKQKTAYEMRISDWSSDVCSSDLLGLDAARAVVAADRAHRADRKLQAHRLHQQPVERGEPPRHLGPRREIRATDRREIVFGKAVQHSGGTAIRSIAWPSCSSHRSGPSSTMVDAASSTNAPRWTPSSPAANTFFGNLPSSNATSAGLTQIGRAHV